MFFKILDVNWIIIYIVMKWELLDMLSIDEVDVVLSFKNCMII